MNWEINIYTCPTDTCGPLRDLNANLITCLLANMKSMMIVWTPTCKRNALKIINIFGTTELSELHWSSHRNYNNNSNTAQLFWGSRGQWWHSADSITLQTFRCINSFYSLFIIKKMQKILQSTKDISLVKCPIEGKRLKN